MIYQNCKYREKRTFPGSAATGSGIVTLGALTTEGYMGDYDLVLPLIPEVQTPPYVIHKFQSSVAALVFTAGEVITAQPSPLLIQILDFTQAPVPGFVRGEIITEAVSLATAQVARRFSDGRYQIISSTGGWLGGANNVTGGGGGGAVTPGRIDATAIEDYRSRYDSVHTKDDSVHLLYEANMCLPPGGAITGVTSGVNAIVTISEPPRVIFDLEFFRTQVANTVMGAGDDQLRLVGLVGDLAQILNPLAADTQTTDRVGRGELFWYADFIVEDDANIMDNNFVLERTTIAGEWGGSTIYAQHGARFQDGIVYRLHHMGGVSSAVGEQATRSLFYYELWDYIKRINH